MQLINSSSPFISNLARAATALGVILGLASIGYATPVTLDFTGGFGNPYTEDGFRVATVNPSNHNELDGSVFNWHDGSANISPNTMRFSDLTGDFLFNAISIDVLNNTQGLRFQGSNGAIVSIAAFSVGTFSLGFQNISYFTMDVILPGNQFPQTIDNVVLDHTQTTGTVPDHGLTIAMLGASFLGLGLLRRRI